MSIESATSTWQASVSAFLLSCRPVFHSAGFLVGVVQDCRRWMRSQETWTEARLAINPAQPTALASHLPSERVAPGCCSESGPRPGPSPFLFRKSKLLNSDVRNLRDLPLQTCLVNWKQSPFWLQRRPQKGRSLWSLGPHSSSGPMNVE